MSALPMKVLIAVDDSAHSEYALKSIMLRPWADGTEFLVFSVIEPFHPDFAGWEHSALEHAEKFAAEQEGKRKKYLEDYAAKLRSTFPNAKVEHEAFENSRIKESIIQKAIDWKADLIIMGSHGRTGLERFLLGSVSQAVVAHAPCSVEIVKHSERHSSN